MELSMDCRSATVSGTAVSHGPAVLQKSLKFATPSCIGQRLDMADMSMI